MNNKRYDDALKRAEAILKVAQNQTEIYNCIITIFPELKESEDERIRKELISFLQLPHPQFAGKRNQEKWLAWLEKQGEKPIDKVEPKFKVGDWVVYNRNDNSREILQVYDIRDDRYYFTDNVHFSWSIKECDERSHLWTIQDAKDGDVLATSAGAFIYNGNDGGGSCPGSYCGINTLGKFQIGVEKHWTGKKVYPATKEQCNTLEKAMADAGYMFDIENKRVNDLLTLYLKCNIHDMDIDGHTFSFK